ncbi:IclR family transcriptional regulator (plasmid) [Rhodococcus sp. USK10]|uniref:IclR family transcriptional regulator n=1 Tax=Rhodococcus sp. USK10 TaxID=2789739 RepID=UPI001C5FBB3F|nr:IclR family transcriptional regulator [Rhodococcus sp. USK10]QYB00221.1 IclR family transcriptional regulator [Rhodococcus sp. USK10]
MQPQPRTEGADTARRALRVLEVISHADQPVSLEEIVRRTDLGKSMVYRLIRALQEESYVERANGGGYTIGGRLFALASAALPNFDAYASYLPLLRALAAESDETCTLHRRAGHRVVLLLGAESEQPLRRVWVAGELTPLAQGSAGLAIMSGLPGKEIDDVLERLDDSAAARARRDVARARRRGYTVSFGVNHPGVNGVAVPVPGLPMAISVSGPDARWSEKRMIEFAPRLIEMVEEFHRVG